jgi:hypothetical protein
MRKVLTGLTMSGLLSLAVAGSAWAATGWSVDVRSATLLAKGAAVEVTFDVVCSGPIYTAQAAASQRVSRNQIASGTTTQYNPPLVCDGAAVNTLTLRVPTNEVAFKHGVALVTASVGPGMGQPYAAATEEVKVGS